MSEIKILIEGYAKQINPLDKLKASGGWIASSTVTLVKSKGKNIIVDTGCNREKLLTALKKEKLKVNDIDFVFLTHNHLDHILFAGIFPKAGVLTSEEIYRNDNQIAHNNIVPGADLKIIQTPGHCNEHCSLIIPTENGIYAIAGDVFWWTDGENQIIDVGKIDNAHPAEVNMENLVDSRKNILKLADYIIPGHGKMFKVEK